MLVFSPVSITVTTCAVPLRLPLIPAFHSFQPVAVLVVKFPLFWRSIGITVGEVDEASRRANVFSAIHFTSAIFAIEGMSSGPARTSRTVWTSLATISCGSTRIPRRPSASVASCRSAPVWSVNSSSHGRAAPVTESNASSQGISSRPMRGLSLYAGW